jgi:hypothetical protein
MSRPWVVFDPELKAHRKWFEEFQRLGTWGRCPVRFITDDNGDLVTMIQRSLIRYYVTKEFGAKNERSIRSVGRNRKKLDKKPVAKPIKKV